MSARSRARRAPPAVTVRALRRWATIACVVGIALAVRWPITRLGLPYLWFPDEPQVVGSSLLVADGPTLTPDFHAYGPVPAYVLAAVQAAAPLPPHGPPTLIGPGRLETDVPEAYLWARRLAALLGAATCGLVAWVAQAMTGRTRSGAAAGVVIALSPGFVLASSTVSVDGFTAFFSAVCLVLAWIADRSGWPRHLVVATALAVAAGVASKFHPVLLVVPIHLLFRSGAVPAGHVRSFHAALWIGVATFFANAWLDPIGVLRGLAGELAHYGAGGASNTDPLPGPDALSFQVSSLVNELSIAVVGAFAALLWRHEDRWARAHLTLVAMYLAMMSLARTSFHRNMFAVYPWIVVGAAIGAEVAWARAAPIVRRWPPSALALVCGILLVHTAGTFGRSVTRAYAAWTEPRDTRTRALRDEAPTVVAAELRVHPRDLLDLPQVRVVGLRSIVVPGTDPCLLPATAVQADGAPVLTLPTRFSAASSPSSDPTRRANPELAIVGCDVVP